MMNLKEMFEIFAKAIELIRDKELMYDFGGWEELNRAVAILFLRLTPEEQRELMAGEMTESYPSSLLAAIIREQQSSCESVTVVGSGEESDLN